VVVGGLDNDNNVLNRVEVVDLSNSGSVCPSLPNYPLGIVGLTLSLYNGKLIGCGGSTKTGLIDQCFELGPDLEEWVEVAQPLPKAIAGLTSSVIDNKLFITGGEDSNYLHNTFIYDGKDFISGPDIPTFKAYHCQLTLNSTHVFITSGVDTETYVFDWPNQKWKRLENGLFFMHDAPCGLLQNPMYGPEALLAVPTAGYLYSFSDEEWSYAPVLRADLINQGHAQVTDGLVVLGGYKSDKIVKFSQDSYRWKQLDVTLEQEKYNFAAVSVPDDFLNCA